MAKNKLPTPQPVTDDKFITVEQFQRALPKELKTKVNPGMVAELNGLMSDPALRENYRDNLLSYTSVMMDGKFKIGDYLNAVRYVSHKLLGASNIEAYAKTFPGRYQRLVNEGADDRTISSYCAAYNKNILVNKILEQTLVPHHVLNADLYQKALNTQANLMVSANSEKVRSDAANSILTHLKAPEATKIELDITQKPDKTIDALRESTLELVAQQKQLLRAGGLNAKDVAHSKLAIPDEDIIEGDCTEVED